MIFCASEIELISPLMHFQKKSTFANNAVSVAADIIRESSFMHYRSNIKECDAEIKIIYCLDEESTFIILDLFNWSLSKIEFLIS